MCKILNAQGAMTSLLCTVLHIENNVIIHETLQVRQTRRRGASC